MVNLPNFLTMSRIVLLPPILYLMSTGRLISAAVLLLMAEITDILDGRLARRYNSVSKFGKIMDPAADTICHLALFIQMVALEWFPALPTIIIASREVIVVALGNIATNSKEVAGARRSGKAKTTVYAVTAIWLLLSHSSATFTHINQEIVTDINSGAPWVCATMAIYSGLDYSVALLKRHKESK